MHTSTLRRKSPDSDDGTCGGSPRSQASSFPSEPAVASQASAIIGITSSEERATQINANPSDTSGAREGGNERRLWTVAGGGDDTSPSTKRRKLVHKADKQAAYDTLSTPTVSQAQSLSMVNIVRREHYQRITANNAAAALRMYGFDLGNLDGIGNEDKVERIPEARDPCWISCLCADIRSQDVTMSDEEDSASQYSCDSLSDEEVSFHMFDGDVEVPEDTEDEDITLPRDIDWYALVGDAEGDLNITVASDASGVEVVTLVFGEDVPTVTITRPDEPEDPWIACRNCVNWRYAQNPRSLLTPGAYIVGDELPKEIEDDTGDDLDEVEGDYILEEFLRTLEEELRQGAAEEPRDPEHASGREGAVIRDICDDYD
ncbi:hypothetical protein GLOTRDRAFT_126613 [Gloeophyllum trabeum ATCC 11539]|uniref:Uncharacterized protein n=1 Tax=Gloeophyllum trabeum (strain ATCC 11539 / FP-39264 / Madison 617) TaxID=670483 RepID=S7QE89_GLOTA|nr:uncharacterized protein GLOTRDRAFT_126613 [Gloeophyllum trabeum ATCC 11539]EPQ58121.1 hypothetical protein GLOTRDRAFT_126613 [Gloeophyllum trabeum ATCC 11539]